MLYGSLNIDIILVLVKIISNYFTVFVAILNRLTLFSSIAGYVKQRKINLFCVFIMYTGEGNGTPLQYSCLENPMDEGAW